MNDIRVIEPRLIDFSDLEGMQDRTVASAVNHNKEWSTEDIAFLAANMFNQSIESLALALGRSAVAVATVFGKDPEFVAIREENGAVISQRHRVSHTQESGRDNRVITSDPDVLWNFGD